jgi:hypothetical protein
MFIVRFSHEKYVTASPDHYLFYWHSGGGAHHAFITTDVDALIRDIAKNSLRYPNFRKKIKSYEEALSYFREEASIGRLPKDTRIFDVIKEFLELNYREVGDVVEVATHRPGKLIGKQGRVIKSLKKHLKKEIKIIQGLYFEIPLDGRVRDGMARVRTGDPASPEIKISEGTATELAFKVYKDKRYGYSVSGGYIAPWHVSEGGDEFEKSQKD